MNLDSCSADPALAVGPLLPHLRLTFTYPPQSEPPSRPSRSVVTALRFG